MGKMKISHSDSDALERAKNTAKANKRAPINKKASLIVYVIVLVLAVAARTVQLFSNMDGLCDNSRHSYLGQCKG